jgi:hypothetical protein
MEGYSRAVGRPGSASVCAWIVRQLSQIATVGIHYVNVIVAIPFGGEGDPPPSLPVRGGSGVAVGGMGVAVNGAVVGDGVAHPTRTIGARIGNVRKSMSFISTSPTGGLLFGLQFKRADVAGCIGGYLRNWPLHPALIGGEGATDRRDRINRRAAGEQGVGPGVAAVVGQGTQHWIAGEVCVAATVFDQVVIVSADRPGPHMTALATDDAVLASDVVGDDCIPDAHFAPNPQSTASAGNGVIADGTVGDLHRACGGNPSTEFGGLVATDGAIDDLCSAAAASADTAA